MNVVFQAEAEAEYLAAVAYYGDRSSELQVRYRVAVEQALRRAGEQPRMYSAIGGGARRCVLAEFPYVIVFRIKGDAVLVVAVTHGKRKPGYWRGRR